MQCIGVHHLHTMDILAPGEARMKRNPLASMVGSNVAHLWMTEIRCNLRQSGRNSKWPSDAVAEVSSVNSDRL